MTELVRVVTVGSVDDGKSTLIGRLLYDSKQVMRDQLAWVERDGRDGGLDLARLTDGLRAERTRSITIDVAHRSFVTPRRRFILADAPGHEEFTRNMVTAASRADLAIVLVDARIGIRPQSRRHALVASLLRVPRVVVCINKMDSVGYDAAVFDAIAGEFAGIAARLEITDLTFIPISALRGDNVVDRSPAMPWYQGSTLLWHLEHAHLVSDRNLIDVRFPVQCEIRGGLHSRRWRGCAGQVASGVIRVGDDVEVLPSRGTARIAEIATLDGPLAEAYPPLSVALRLSAGARARRGDLLCRPHNRPVVTREFEATVCWMAEAPLREGARLLLMHMTRTVAATVEAVRYRLDVETLHRNPSVRRLDLNEIGRIRLRASAPLAVDPYQRNRATGSLILVDESTGDTAGAAVILDAEASAD
jgi:bifunctional enzyme CysN/CysC